MGQEITNYCSKCSTKDAKDKDFREKGKYNLMILSFELPQDATGIPSATHHTAKVVVL